MNKSNNIDYKQMDLLLMVHPWCPLVYTYKLCVAFIFPGRVTRQERSQKLKMNQKERLFKSLVINLSIIFRYNHTKYLINNFNSCIDIISNQIELKKTLFVHDYKIVVDCLVPSPKIYVIEVNAIIGNISSNIDFETDEGMKKPK